MNITHFLRSLLVILNQMSPYILLGFFIAGLLHEFVKPDLMSRHLSGNGWRPAVKAALLGIPLPLCSCGVLPTAVALRRSGASKAASTSFLIATPQTGVDSIAATWSLLGPAFAVIRPIAALVGAAAGGVAVGSLDPEENLADAPEVTESAIKSANNSHSGFFSRMLGALRYGMVDMVASVGKWLVIGLVIAALITVFVPDSLFLSISQYPLAAMLLMVAIAIPMYICATGSIPIALSLMLKGLTPGVGFVLLMAGPAANFASVMVLRRAMGARATAIYVGSVVVTALLFGLAIDYLLPSAWFTPDASLKAACCHGAVFRTFDSICSVVLVSLLIYAFVSRFHRRPKCGCSASCDSSNANQLTSDTQTAMTNIYHISGMSCPHCQKRVEEGLALLPGVDSVVVDLAKAQAVVTGSAEPDIVIAAITRLGYDFVPPVEKA